MLGPLAPRCLDQPIAVSLNELAEAERMLDFMFEEKALRYLARHSSPRLDHGVIIVRKQVAAA